MNEEIYIERCLQLAEKGKGTVAPNPMVGAELVYQGRIIGEGFHQQYGQAHAEVNCFESVAEQDKQFIPLSTMYVSLEPCAHFGKTPPCAHRIVKEKVKRVVICNTDPFKQVAGKGIQILESEGIEVVTGILEEKGAWLNRRFFTFHQQKRPYIILKWAQTEKGLFAPKDHSRLQMSDEYSKRLSHQWRREESAIIVGFTTAKNDNPQLIDQYGQSNQPLRIAMDKDLTLPLSHHLLVQDYPTWIINQHKEESISNLHFIQLDFTKNIIPQLSERLYQANILSLIVEGGVQLLQSFIDAGTWDEARFFETPDVLTEGLLAPSLTSSKKIFETQLRQDKLKVYLRQNNRFSMPKDANF
ncbi:MAG: bifunctional diaminohydroxyphosphoribosylaminopyrimidine deaminase/5-amino-6-(5-phosphoribosylamino)uracil reductase RibD [Bacteroidota bacterium]